VHIATGVETSVNDLAARLAALIGTAVRPTTGLAIPGEVHRIALGIDRAEAVLGWRARTSLEEGLRRTVEWLRKRSATR